jgi:hypothetical protein
MVNSARRRKAKRIAEKLVIARAALAEYDVNTIEEILKRGECSSVPDGMRGESDGTGGPSTATSVESSALYGLPGDVGSDYEEKPDDWDGHIPHDPTGLSIIEIWGRIDEVVSICKILDKRRQVVIHSGDGRRARKSKVGYCSACGRLVIGEDNDRLRSGYCDRVSAEAAPWSGCYRLWDEQHRPDRLGFENWVKSQMAIQAEQRARDDAEARANVPVAQLPTTTLPNSKKERPEVAPATLGA